MSWQKRRLTTCTEEVKATRDETMEILPNEKEKNSPDELCNVVCGEFGHEDMTSESMVIWMLRYKSKIPRKQRKENN